MFQVSLHLFAINVKNLLKIDYRADKRHQVDSQRAGNPQFTHWTSEYSDPQAKKNPNFSESSLPTHPILNSTEWAKYILC